MKEYKKFILGLGLDKGRAVSIDGRFVYQDSLAGLARLACDGGADELLIWDFSKTDEEHEEAILLIREAVRQVDVPVILGGYVKRLEDVKKYLYAGADAVFLDASDQENVDMMKEASDRFGSEKIYACLTDPGALAGAGEYAQLGASLMLIKTTSGTLSLAQLGEIDAVGHNSLVFCTCLEEPAAFEANLKLILGCPCVLGTVLCLPESMTDAVMALKQQMKGAGIEADTFESAVAFNEFKLNSDGLIPVIVQDYKTDEVLMLAYMNEEAFLHTLKTGKMTYYSRSRRQLWVKGETSGHYQYVKSLKIDCDKDTILARVRQLGAACHTGNYSCFYTGLADKEYHKTNPLKVFEEEYATILDRKKHPKEGSYTNYLFDKGIDKILKKIGEESTEIVIAAKNTNPEEVKYEIADFLYHMMVLMVQKGITWEDVTAEVANR